MINNPVFGKATQNVRKDRDIKLVTTGRRRNYLVSEPNYHTTKVWAILLKSISNRIEKTEIFTNKPVCFGLSILELSKISMHEFRYD